MQVQKEIKGIVDGKDEGAGRRNIRPAPPIALAKRPTPEAVKQYWRYKPYQR